MAQLKVFIGQNIQMSRQERMRKLANGELSLREGRTIPVDEYRGTGLRTLYRLLRGRLFFGSVRVDRLFSCFLEDDKTSFGILCNYHHFPVEALEVLLVLVRDGRVLESPRLSTRNRRELHQATKRLSRGRKEFYLALIQRKLRLSGRPLCD